MSLPEMVMTTLQFANLKMAIEIVSFPIKNGDFPYKSPFSHGFPIKNGDLPEAFHGRGQFCDFPAMAMMTPARRHLFVT